jgi:hypothetical protein
MGTKLITGTNLFLIAVSGFVYWFKPRLMSTGTDLRTLTVWDANAVNYSRISPLFWWKINPMRYLFAVALGLCLIGFSGTVAYAQNSQPASSDSQDLSTVDPIFLLWSRNIARRAAEAENGGLGNYMAEASMHGPTSQAPLVLNDDGSLTFVFKGYRPDAIDFNGNPTFSVETEVLVRPDRTFEVIYNGPIRTSPRVMTGPNSTAPL